MGIAATTASERADRAIARRGPISRQTFAQCPYMQVQVCVLLTPPRIAPPWRLPGVRSDSVFLLSVSFFFGGAAVRLASLLARVVIGNSSRKAAILFFRSVSYVASAFRRTYSECHRPCRSG